MQKVATYLTACYDIKSELYFLSSFPRSQIIFSTGIPIGILIFRMELRLKNMKNDTIQLFRPEFRSHKQTASEFFKNPDRFFFIQFHLIREKHIFSIEPIFHFRFFLKYLDRFYKIIRNFCSKPHLQIKIACLALKPRANDLVYLSGFPSKKGH